MQKGQPGAYGNPGRNYKNEAREGRKRERPGLYAYLSLGKARHALFPNAGWNSTARCGNSPHWADPVGWMGQEEGEKEKLLELPWCGRCARLIKKDQLYLAALPPALREMLGITSERLPGGGTLHG